MSIHHHPLIFINSSFLLPRPWTPLVPAFLLMISPISLSYRCSHSGLERSQSVLNCHATPVEHERSRLVPLLSRSSPLSLFTICQCDRIQPCTACSLHQIANHCEFDLTEAERHPILQAEALKEKDKTIVQLRHELAALRGDPIKAEPVDEVISFGQNGAKIKLPPKVSSKKPSTIAQKREYLGEMSHNIFFGSPGMTSVVEEVSSSPDYG